MMDKTRASPRDGVSLGLLILLGLFVLGLFALVSGVPTTPHPARGTMPAIVANGAFPPATLAIHQAETRDAVLMQAALDRIGFDLAAVAQGYVSVPQVLVASLPPDLDRLDAMDGRKVLFLRLLLPVVLYVNEQIGIDRQRLLTIRGKMAIGRTLEAEEVQLVLALADAYDQPDADVDALVKKVDVVPPSLALAQAIEESGWGTSRIARHNNALFGQFSEAASGDWDYRNFASLTEAVASYARNLNTHRAYRDFRLARAQMRSERGDIDSWQLVAKLHQYSERGDDYVQSLRSIMRDNGLEAFDAARLNGRRVATIVASSD